MGDTTTAVSNWSHSVYTKPAVIAKPTTIEEVQEILRDGEKYPSPVRPMGNYHSTTGCAVADGGTLVDMTAMQGILEIGPQQVRAEAGAIYADVADALVEEGLNFYVDLEIGNITLGSVATCATKDGAYPGEHGQAGAYVSAVTMVTADGNVIDVDEDSDEELMRAIRSSYGLLGIVVAVTIRVRPLENISVRHVNFSTDEFLEKLPELRSGDQSVAFYIFPFADKMTVQLRGPARRSGRRNRWLWPMRNLGVAYGVPLSMRLVNLLPGAGLRLALSRAFFWMARLMLSLLLRSGNTRPTDQITRYRHRPRLAHFTFSIWGFPEAEYPRILREYRDFCRDYYREHKYRPDLLTVGYHVTQSRHALLSYSWDGDVMTIDPVASGGEQWDRFVAAFNGFCDRNGGQPLMNQSPALNNELMKNAFGRRLEDFKAVRDQYDPQRRLLNDHFAELLGV